MICPQCKLDNRSGARFCNNCRYSLAPQPEAEHATMRGAANHAPHERNTPTGRFLAFFPPLGQFYNGDILKGVVISVLYLIELWSDLTILGASIGLPAMFFTWLWGFTDARKVLRGEKEPWS
jgi:hypothetical protein